MFNARSNPLPKYDLPVLNAFKESLGQLAPTTIRCYIADICTLLHFLKGDNEDAGQELLWVDNETITRFFAHINEIYSKASIARRISALRLFYNFCVKQLYITNSPMDLIESPKLDKRHPQMISLEDIEKIIAIVPRTLHGCRDKALLELLAFTGISISELANVQFFDIDIENKTMRIKGKVRNIKLSERVAKSIRQYVTQRKLLTENHLFLNRFGKKISERSIRRNLNMYAIQAGITITVNPQILKHSYAYRLASQGIQLLGLRDALGHKSVGSVKIYTRMQEQEVAECYEESMICP